MPCLPMSMVTPTRKRKSSRRNCARKRLGPGRVNVRMSWRVSVSAHSVEWLALKSLLGNPVLEILLLVVCCFMASP